MFVFGYFVCSVNFFKDNKIFWFEVIYLIEVFINFFRYIRIKYSYKFYYYNYKII